MYKMAWTLMALFIFIFGPGGAQVPGVSINQPVKKLYVVGVSHLDTQWRWTIQNTINEYVPATFRDNFKLMDIYTDYIFSFEGAFKYMLLKEYYPEEYKRLKPYIDRGQWRLAGGWVDAVDVNMPSFESLVRHTLYGNGFFKQEFGKISRDILLPDCFGFGYSLPSIAAHCGLKSFSTQKLTWGSSVGVPFDIGIWEGVDGSSLVAALNPGQYVSKIQGDLSRDTVWQNRIDSQGSKTGLYAGYMYFGTGDTGGAPDSNSVDWLSKSMKSDGPITVRSIGSDDLSELVGAEKDINLNRYRGELLMRRHGVGCYSSQAAMKRWNRKNELLADAAERASVIADLMGEYAYPKQTLKDTWIRFLWHQFHDDLTGTSIPEAYQFSWNDEILCQNRFAGILENAVEATSPMLDTRVKGIPLIVYNPLSILRKDVVEATITFAKGAPGAVRIYNPLGKEVPSQIIKAYKDSLKILFLAEVPSVGYAVYDIQPATAAGSAKTDLEVTASTIENGRLLVTLDENGDIASIFDKLERRPLLSERLRWQLLNDKPKQWPAWEIQYEDITAEPKGFVGGEPQVRILESGPVRASLEVIRKTRQSVFRNVISLCAGEFGNKVEFDNEVDWYEQETLLKAAFKLNAPNDSVTYDIGLGIIKRGLDTVSLYEVPAHQWVDMTARDGRYGVAILNDCKYGWDHPDIGTIRLTLIHTPGVFENWSWVGDQSSQDKGHHRFKYAILGHSGGWREAAVPWEAARFNQPLMAFQTTRHIGQKGNIYSLLRIQKPITDKKRKMVQPIPSIMVNAVKRAENGEEIVIRLRELTGIPSEKVQIKFARPIAEAREINGVEETIGTADIKEGMLITSLAPYQPKAYALKLSVAKEKRTSSRAFKSLPLIFDLDGISMDSDRRDGNLDDSGNTIAGDLLPDTLICHMIPFVTGPKSPGVKNVLSCDGQTMNLPTGSFTRLYLLGTSVGGPAVGSFTVVGSAGSHETEIPIPDNARFLGQWNSRLVGGELVEEAGQIAPAYINREPVAWVGTHRHTAEGENEAYRYTNLYLIRLDLPVGAHSLKLPENKRIKILAATAAKVNWDNIRTARPLYDIANNTLTDIYAPRKGFIDSLAFQISCPIPGAAIHYTLDNSDPGRESPLYTKPLVLTQTTTVKSRAFKEGGDNSHITAITFNKLIPREPEPVANKVPGLKCLYYEGEWSKLPDFDTLKIKKDVICSTVAVPDFAREEYYGLGFIGYVNIPREGLYDFYISSDDGSRLIVGDSTVADNDGIHGTEEKSCAAALKAGLQPIKVYMFQGEGDRFLDISIQGPGLKKQSIPAEMLFRSKR